MKVNNNKDPSELAQLGRTKHGGKAGAAKGKEAGESSGATVAGGSAEAAGVEISSEAKTLAAANSAARAGASDTDDAKIARVKAMINSGTYKPDMGQVADKVMNEHLMQELS
jgi:flagellar biosynthesis anti-sigma factor FlgM